MNAATAHKTANGDKIWIIEEDDTWTPGFLVDRNCAAAMFGGVKVERSGVPGTVVWSKRNIIDHETGERMR